jgi:tetratricopeptide (TPR) repeat protein
MRTIIICCLIGILPAFGQNSLESEVRLLLLDHQYPEVINKLEGQSLHPQLEMFLVKAYQETGQMSKALKLLQQMWANDTTSKPVALNLGETYYSRRQYRQAYRWFARLTVLEPKTAYYHKLAGKTASRVASLKGLAISHYQKALNLEPHDRDAAYALALLYFEFGQNLNARPITQQFVTT